MNYFQEGFKKEIFNYVFKLTGKTWVKITFSQLILTLVMLVFGVIVGLTAYASGPLAGLFENPQTFNNPEEIQNLLSSSAFTEMFTAGFIIIMLIFIFIILFVGSWLYNFAFITADMNVKGKNADFMTILRLSFNGGILKIIGSSILLYLISAIAYAIAFYTASFSSILCFFLVLFVSVFIYKFTLVLPAYVIGGKSLSESFSYSYKHITWLRALKLFGASILAIIILFLIAMIIGLIAMLFAMIPFLGPLIQLAINTVFGGIMMALFVSVMVGLYYRYADNINLEEEDNDQLIIDALQE